jgi:hypothetical protein
MLKKMGIFIMLVGIIFVLISFGSVSANSQSITMLCSGIPMILLGLTIWYRNRDRTPAERFRIFRGFSSKEEEDEDDE